MEIVTDIAKETDIPAIMELLKRVHEVHASARPDIFPGQSKYTEEQIKEILTNPVLPVIVARDIKNNNSLYIDDLCVDKSCRGRGVGRILYNAAVQFAREHDCYNITLNVWELNSSAKAFYQKMGLLPLKTTLEKIL